MIKKIAKVLLGIGGLLLTASIGLVAFVHLQWNRSYDDVPYPDLHASTDSAVIARGAYLAYGPAHCAYCHTPREQMPLVDKGEQPPLTGGFEWVTPIGVLRSPNITPDAETGIGRFTDGELARMIRHNVRPDGRGTLPIMEFSNLSDEDVVAVISFLRSQEPVHHAVPDHDLNLLGKAVMTLAAKPVFPKDIPRVASPAEGPTLERGAYLANAVANCAGCHSKRNGLDASYIGPRFAGGGEMEVDGDPTRVFITPNLTPDPRTGRITRWTEDQFVARFRQGKVIKESHMPWGPYSRMSDDDLRAIYRYLMSLPPVENETGPSLQVKKS